MQMVSTNSQNNRILILADFSEGSWTAIRFAMEYLYKPNSEVYIIQTWQKPGYGSSMVRDLGPILQNIAENELQALQRRLMDRYNFSEKQIHLVPFEGELTDFFESETYQQHAWQVVMATKNQMTDISRNPRFTNIIDNVNHPLYMLNEIEYVRSIENVFVLSDSDQPSAAMLNTLGDLCEDQKCYVQVCIDTDLVSVADKEKQVHLFADACKGSTLRFSKMCNDNGMFEIEEYENRKVKRLMIFDRTRNRKVESGLKSYLDKWLVRSKGISIGNH